MNKSHGSNIWCMTLSKSHNWSHQLSSMLFPGGLEYTNRLFNRFNKSHGTNIWCMTLTKSYHRPRQLSSMIVPRGWKYIHNFFNILSTVWTKVMAPTSSVSPCRKVATDHISCLPCLFQKVVNVLTDILLYCQLLEQKSWHQHFVHDLVEKLSQAMSAVFHAFSKRLRIYKQTFQYIINSLNKCHGTNIWCTTFSKSCKWSIHLTILLVWRGWESKNRPFNILPTVWIKVKAPRIGVWT